MKGYFTLIYAINVLHSITHCRAEYDVTSICTLVKDNVRVASTDSCKNYFTCQNGKAIAESCPDEQLFHKDHQLCKPSTEVDCYWGVATPCSTRDEPTFIPIVGTCKGWIHCKDGKEAGRGECGQNLVFKDGRCEYGECREEYDPSGLQSICQIMPNNKYFGSSIDCARWQICRNDLLKFGYCKNSLVYNPLTGECIYEMKNTCNYVTGESILPDEEISGTCTSSDSAIASVIKCSMYFQCINGEWTRRDCAANQFYDIVEKQCADYVAAITNDKCDRCEFSKGDFVNDVDPKNCSKYVYCRNGKRKSKGSCPSGRYFNEPSQACLSTGEDVNSAEEGSGENDIAGLGTSLALYNKSHGACKTNDVLISTQSYII